MFQVSKLQYINKYHGSLSSIESSNKEFLPAASAETEVFFNLVQVVTYSQVMLENMTNSLKTTRQCSSRSSRLEVFFKKVVLRNFAKFQENTCARVSFLRKLQASVCNFLKKSFWNRCFPVSSSKFPRHLFLQNLR